MTSVSVEDLQREARRLDRHTGPIQATSLPIWHEDKVGKDRWGNIKPSVNPLLQCSDGVPRKVFRLIADEVKTVVWNGKMMGAELRKIYDIVKILYAAGQLTSVWSHILKISGKVYTGVTLMDATAFIREYLQSELGLTEPIPIRLPYPILLHCVSPRGEKSVVASLRPMMLTASGHLRTQFVRHYGVPGFTTRGLLYQPWFWDCPPHWDGKCALC